MGILSNIFNKKAKTSASVDFEVSLSCDKCAKRVKDLLAADKAVAKAHVELSSKSVSIQYDKNKTDEDNLRKEIESLGFKVTKIKGQK